MTINNPAQQAALRHDPSNCNTQRFFDREVELILCEEGHNCPYKRLYNHKVLCTCPNIELRG